MTLLDKLRQHAGTPYAFHWATIPLSINEARELAAALEQIEQLRAELAAATRRCTDCGRSSRDLKPWEEQGQVVAWLGPSCHRRRQDERPAAALPIGGAR